MSDSITMREAWRLDIEELKAERDEALEALQQLQQPPQIPAILAGKMAGNTQSEQFSKLERERDLLRVQFRAAEGLGLALVKTIDELKAERNEAINHLSTIAEDCEAWLNSQIDEPSMEFIKLVRDYAKKAI